MSQSSVFYIVPLQIIHLLIVSVVKFSRNGVPPPVSGVPPPEIAVPPPKVVFPPPGSPPFGGKSLPLEVRF